MVGSGCRGPGKGALTIAGRYSYTAANKSATTLTIYGRVAGGQDVAAGSYSDTVVASAEF